jgi:hypothetical protein
MSASPSAPYRTSRDWDDEIPQAECTNARGSSTSETQLVVGQGMKPVVSGLALGIIATFALGRLIAAQLYQVSAHDPVLLGGATVLLAATALMACLLPARRAVSVDPMVALRTE